MSRSPFSCTTTGSSDWGNDCEYTRQGTYGLRCTNKPNRISRICNIYIYNLYIYIYMEVSEIQFPKSSKSWMTISNSIETVWLEDPQFMEPPIYIIIHVYIYIALYSILLYHFILYSILLYHFILYSILLYHIILYYIMLYQIILYYIISYHIILYYNILYHIILYYIISYDYHIMYI